MRTRDPFEKAELDGSVRCSHLATSLQNLGPDRPVRNHGTTYPAAAPRGFRQQPAPLICRARSRRVDLGWEPVVVLDLTALPSIDEER